MELHWRGWIWKSGGRWDQGAGLDGDDSEGKRMDRQSGCRTKNGGGKSRVMRMGTRDGCGWDVWGKERQIERWSWTSTGKDSGTGGPTWGGRREGRGMCQMDNGGKGGNRGCHVKRTGRGGDRACRRDRAG